MLCADADASRRVLRDPFGRRMNCEQRLWEIGILMVLESSDWSTWGLGETAGGTSGAKGPTMWRIGGERGRPRFRLGPRQIKHPGPVTTPSFLLPDAWTPFGNLGETEGVFK